MADKRLIGKKCAFKIGDQIHEGIIERGYLMGNAYVSFEVATEDGKLLKVKFNDIYRIGNTYYNHTLKV
mgnify:CR=1 FL=1